MTMGNKQIEKIVCVACSELIGEHSRRQLERCLFRIQGTMVASGLNTYKAHNEDRVEDKRENVD